MTRNRYLWVTALLVAPTTALAVYAAIHGPHRLWPIVPILAVPTLVWIGGLLFRAMSLCRAGAILSVIMILWGAWGVWMLARVGAGLA